MKNKSIITLTLVASLAGFENTMTMDKALVKNPKTRDRTIIKELVKELINPDFKGHGGFREYYGKIIGHKILRDGKQGEPIYSGPFGHTGRTHIQAATINIKRAITNKNLNSLLKTIECEIKSIDVVSPSDPGYSSNIKVWQEDRYHLVDLKNIILELQKSNKEMQLKQAAQRLKEPRKRKANVVTTTTTTTTVTASGRKVTRPNFFKACTASSHQNDND